MYNLYSVWISAFVLTTKKKKAFFELLFFILFFLISWRRLRTSILKFRLPQCFFLANRQSGVELPFFFIFCTLNLASCTPEMLFFFCFFPLFARFSIMVVMCATCVLSVCFCACVCLCVFVRMLFFD